MEDTYIATISGPVPAELELEHDTSPTHLRGRQLVALFREGANSFKTFVASIGTMTGAGFRRMVNAIKPSKEKTEPQENNSETPASVFVSTPEPPAEKTKNAFSVLGSSFASGYRKIRQRIGFHRQSQDEDNLQQILPEYQAQK